ncbi:MAG: GC-type dockerin domain-anchored protein [Phycisphaerales bacterium JB037]
MRCDSWILCAALPLLAGAPAALGDDPVTVTSAYRLARSTVFVDGGFGRFNEVEDRREFFEDGFMGLSTEANEGFDGSAGSSQTLTGSDIGAALIVFDGDGGVNAGSGLEGLVRAETEFGLEVTLQVAEPIAFEVSGLIGANGPDSTVFVQLRRGVTPVFELERASFPIVPFGESGTLEPGGYTLVIEGLASRTVSGGQSGGGAIVIDLRLEFGSACAADLTGSSDPNDASFGEPDGDADGDDFFFYLDAFSAGELGVCDLTGSSDPNDASFDVPDGDCDGDDFFRYLDLFVGGCA